jgi:hypothetical protein
MEKKIIIHCNNNNWKNKKEEISNMGISKNGRN